MIEIKFTKSFNEKFSAGKKEVKISAFRSPNTNAFVERFIQTIKQECLDHFVVFGRSHFDHICTEFSVHYLEERPHQGLENETIGKSRRKVKPQSSPHTIRMSDIRCKERLGGLLKHYSRAA
jgi:putative transposase